MRVGKERKKKNDNIERKLRKWKGRDAWGRKKDSKIVKMDYRKGKIRREEGRGEVTEITLEKKRGNRIYI